MRISDWSSDVCSSDLIAAGPIAFYAPEAVPTGDAAWVFRRAGALRAIFKDSEHFTARGWSSFSQLIGDSWSQVPVERSEEGRGGKECVCRCRSGGSPSH